MPRKGHIAKRDVLVDPIYNSKLVTRLINKIMIDGKKGVAQTILYNAFEIVEVKTGKAPMEVFEQALENVMPQLELKVRRVGGANYQVPVEVSDERRLTLGLRWIVNYARLRNEKTMEQRLAAEIIDASNGTGASVKKREDTHKMAEANKAMLTTVGKRRSKEIWLENMLYTKLVTSVSWLTSMPEKQQQQNVFFTTLV